MSTKGGTKNDLRKVIRGLQARVSELLEENRKLRDVAGLSAPSKATISDVIDSVDHRTIKRLVDRFVAWPLPESVCSDRCACERGYPHRTGTNLLTATEAEAMLKYLLGPALTRDAANEEEGEMYMRGFFDGMEHEKVDNQRDCPKCGRGTTQPNLCLICQSELPESVSPPPEYAKIVECTSCGKFTTILEAECRRFNRGRCGFCGGPLFPVVRKDPRNPKK